MKRVVHGVAGLLWSVTAAYSITIPITSSTGTTFTQGSPANTLAGQLGGTYTTIANGVIDTKWKFTRYADSSGNPVSNPTIDGAYVFHNPGKAPMDTPSWFIDAPSPNPALKSRWISATKLNGNGSLTNAAVGRYYAYSEFQLAANTSQAVFAGKVWGGDFVTGVDLFNVTSNAVVTSILFGNPTLVATNGGQVAVSSLNGAAGPLYGNSAAFNINQGFLSAGTYQLRFHMTNVSNGLDYAGIRVEFDHGMHYATPEPVSSSLMLTAGVALVWGMRRRRAKSATAL